MVGSVGVVGSEARTFSVLSSRASGELASAGRVFTIFNFPSAFVQSTKAAFLAPVKRNSVEDVSSVRLLAVVRGRVANPALRVWTFTLDGHDFYVIRLGDDTTLLYDISTEQWADWDSKASGAWRANTGITWVGGQALADNYGSSVLAGDDTFGLLWFLDPYQAYDDAPDPFQTKQQIDYERVATGQVLASGRQYMPCFAIFVDGDNYGLVATDFVPTVTLDYSDDQGRNFVTTETLLVQTDLGVNNPYAWYSLGQISSPGRIFRVRDNGLFARIDSMSMNDDG